MRFLFCLGLIALGTLLIRPALAEDLPGQSAPEFQEAVALWLDDDEAAALPELARLARGGNTSAQILLALIDKTPSLQGPWLARVPRAERAALMRAEGGMSGVSWMRTAAETEPLARLWLRLWSTDARAPLVIDFARAGEDRAAREAVVTLVARQRRAMSEIAAAPEYPRGMRYHVWLEWERDPDMEGAVAAELALLAPGDPQRQFVGDALDDEELARWLVSAPEAEVIARLCDERCGDTARSCARAVYEALSGYSTLMVFGSPSARLIDPVRFAQSPRGKTALLRRVLLNSDARGRRPQIARARAIDACFGDLLEAEVQRYMPRRD